MESRVDELVEIPGEPNRRIRTVAQLCRELIPANKNSAQSSWTKSRWTVIWSLFLFNRISNVELRRNRRRLGAKVGVSEPTLETTAYF